MSFRKVYPEPIRTFSFGRPLPDTQWPCTQGVTATANRVYLRPTILRTFERAISVSWVSWAPGGGDLAIVGLYRDNPIRLGRIFTSGSFAVSPGNPSEYITNLASPVLCAPGLYWLAIMAQTVSNVGVGFSSFGNGFRKFIGKYFDTTGFALPSSIAVTSMQDVSEAGATALMPISGEINFALS